MRLLEAESLSGLYGGEPQIETITMFRNEMYQLIERDVDNWIVSTRFLARFSLSALLFVGLYFLFSFVARDPLPIVDELLIALAGAVGLSYFLRRRARKSDEADQRRAALRRLIDGIRFHQSDLLVELETILAECRKRAPVEMLRYVNERLAGLIASGDTARSLVNDLGKQLEERFSERRYAGIVRTLLRTSKKGSAFGNVDEKMVTKLTTTFTDDEIGLFLLYISIKHIIVD